MGGQLEQREGEPVSLEARTHTDVEERTFLSQFLSLPSYLLQ
jgi:hypothetical protein